VVDFLISLFLSVFVFMTTGAFYYHSQMLDQQIKKLEQERMWVEEELKACETARAYIESQRALLAQLEAKLKLARQRTPKKKEIEARRLPTSH
jgi:Tfp pilus assembly protein PilO